MMKRILSISVLLLCFGFGYTQTVYPIVADTVKIKTPPVHAASDVYVKILGNISLKRGNVDTIYFADGTFQTTSLTATRLSNWNTAYSWGDWHSSVAPKWDSIVAKEYIIGTYVPLIRTINGYPLSSNVTLNKSDVGLSNVPNVDATNPANISQTSTYRFATDAEKATWNAKEPAVTIGNTTDYYRGDKTFQPLNKAAVGLSNVDNTSDVNKPISIATQSALNLKFNLTDTASAFLAYKLKDIEHDAAIATKQPTLVSGTNIKTINSITLLGAGDIPVSSFIGYTPENVANKAIDFTVLNNTRYPSVSAVKTLVDASVANGNTAYSWGNHASFGYLTSYTETDPTIYSWAKAATKPSYGWTEIGSRPTLLSQFTNDLGNYGGFLTTESDPVYTASSWYTTTNNSTNWNTAYSDRMKWDGGSTGLVAATGRASLGLVIGTDVLAYRTFGSAANNNTGDFYASGSTVANSTLWSGMSYLGTLLSSAPTYIMSYTGGNWRPSDATSVAAFLSGQTLSVNISGYATSETLATVTGRGNTTTTLSWLNGGIGFDQSGVRSWTVSAGSGNLLFGSGDGNGGFIFNATGVTVNGRLFAAKTGQNAYTNAAFEVYTSDGGETGISFHRGGVSAGFLAHGSYGGLRFNGNQLLMSDNFNSYSPTLTGGNASGSWGINITGKADGAFKLWATDYPTSYYLTNTWNGTYWRIASNHGAGVSVEHASNATLWNSKPITWASAVPGSYILGWNDANADFRPAELYQVKSWLGLGTAAYTASTAYVKSDGTQGSFSNNASPSYFVTYNTGTGQLTYATVAQMQSSLSITSGGETLQSVMSRNSNTATIITSSSGEPLRMVQSSAYISAYNSSGTTRTGYMQFNAGGNIIIASENANGLTVNGGTTIFNTPLTVNSTVWTNTGIRAAINGTSDDPYGAVSVTNASGANYSYYGLTRSGILGIGMGLNTSNEFWIGNTTGGGASSVLSGSPWMRLNSSSAIFQGSISGVSFTGHLYQSASQNISHTGGAHTISGNSTGYLHLYGYTQVYFENPLIIRGTIANDYGNVVIDDALTVNGTATTSGFVLSGSSNSYFLLGGGSHTQTANYFGVGVTNTIQAANYYTANGQYFYSNKGASTYIANTDNPALQAYSTDNGPAFMSFHRAGVYAVNFGLDINNQLVVGGWSVGSASRFNLDLPNGGLTISSGVAMTNGWNRTMVLSSTFPTLVFNSANTKWAGIAYDYSSDMIFKVHSTSADIFASGINAMIINSATGNISTYNHFTAGGSVTATSDMYITNTNGGRKVIKTIGGTTTYNFMIGNQENYSNEFEITGSSAAGTTTYNRNIARFNAATLATVLGGALTTIGDISTSANAYFGNYLFLNSKLALRGTDTYLRLNQNGEFTDGVYTPSTLRSGTSVVGDSYVIGGYLRSNSNVYIDQNYGYGIVGLYSAIRYQGVFAMGDSYKLSADGTSTGTLYGIAWTHSNVGGQSASGLGHQMLVMTNGSTKTALGDGIWTAVNINYNGGYITANKGLGGTGAQIVVQTNDTYLRLNPNNDFSNGVYIANNIRVDGNSYFGPGTYYINSSIANLAATYVTSLNSSNQIVANTAVYAGTWFYNSGQQGLYNSSYGGYFYQESSNYWTLTSNYGLIIRNGYNSTVKGYLYYDVTGFGLLNNSGSWAVRTNTSTDNELHGTWKLQTQFNISANGASPDNGYGALTVTQANTANYTHIGLIRQGTYAMGMGLNTSNDFWIGAVTGAGAASVLSGTAYLRINTSGKAFFKDAVDINYGLSVGSGTFMVASNGVVTGANNMTITGNITATAFYQSSDIRLKNVISQSGDMITYTWKDLRDKLVHYGYSAQEKEINYPFQVSTATDGIKSVNYIEIHTKKINDLEIEVSELKNLINQLLNKQQKQL